MELPINTIIADNLQAIIAQFNSLDLSLELEPSDLEALKTHALTCPLPSKKGLFCSNYGAPLLYYLMNSSSSSTSTSTSTKKVLLLGGIHPDEIGPLYSVWKLLIQFLKNPLNQNNEIIFVPLLNPDCFIGDSEEGFTPSRIKVNGVDLNRDFYNPSDTHLIQSDFQAEPEIDFLLQLIELYDPSHFVVMHSPLNLLELDGFCTKEDREWINRVHDATGQEGGPCIPVKKFETYSEKTHMKWSFGHLIKSIKKTALTFEYPGPKQSGKQAKLLDKYYRKAIGTALDIEGVTVDAYTDEAELIKSMSPIELATYAHNHYGYPSKELYVIGVTGTNGKTTVAYLLGEVLKAAGFNPFVLGTLNSGNRDLSTPESLDTLRLMRTHLDQGGTHFIMEVTSEGIDQSRVLGINFDIKILTNITQDHLDYHKTFERYQETKLSFMKEGDGYKIYPENFKNEPIYFSTMLLGNFNLLNVKVAAKALRYMNISENHIQDVLSVCPAPRGRLEQVEKGQLYMVIIDYAHTPDAIENVLRTVKKVSSKRKGNLFVLFGCGGDRDKGKRPEMGRIATKIANFIVITDDNPRSENSQEIMDEIVTGFPADFKNYKLIQNRDKAIKFIINKAQDNDVVILVGKGHETYQILKSKTIHFDDREEASDAILLRLKDEGLNDDALIE